MNTRKNFFNKIIICSVIFLCTLTAQAASLPSDPNNAALLYYQALSLWSDVRSSYADIEAPKDPNDDTDTIQEPNGDSESRPTLGNTKLDIDKLIALERKMEREYERKYGKKMRESRRRQQRNLTIQIVEAASLIPRCSWGIYHSKGWGLVAIGSLRQFAMLLEDDAQALADAGDYRMALERCLTLRRFACHLGDEGVFLHNTSLFADGVAFRSIKYVLESMPPDADTLVWLKNQLAATPGATESLVPALEIDFEVALQRLQRSPETIARIRGRLMEEVGVLEEKETENGFKSLTDEKLILVIQEQASQIISEFFNSVRRVVESDKPFDQTHSEIELLTYKLSRHDELVPFYGLTSISVTPRFHNLHVNLKTKINGVKAAVEAYLVLAKTGQLPKTLPDGLPKDPYSGEDFKYEITKEGFVLHSKGKDFQGSLKRMLEFKIKK
ncbi:MAG: hypothetical protein GY845_12130 [Planctomycetes bacterium]|nr:hypothetical protein [Planctomycetota bacterium]